MYRELYLLLFNAITDALECLRAADRKGAEEILTAAQQKAEERYMEQDL